MQKTNLSLLLHPVFLGSLLLLLLNDHLWKYQYPNWLTGKLSDVAGLVVLPVFLRAFFPHHTYRILLITASLFTWWKSPLSEPLLVFFSETVFVPLIRTVDYTDLFALAVLPLAARLKGVRFALNGAAQTCLRAAAGTLAFVSLCSTSIGYRYGLRYGYREHRTNLNEEFNTNLSRAEILANLQRKGLSFYADSIVYLPVINSADLYYRIGQQRDTNLTWKPVPQSADSAIFQRRNVGTYYVIPAFVLDGDTLRTLEFTIDSRPGRKKQSSLWVESFETKNPGKYQPFSRRKRKPFRKIFEALFLSP